MVPRYLRTLTTPCGVNKDNADRPKSIRHGIAQMPANVHLYWQGDASHNLEYKFRPRAAMMPNGEDASMQLRLDKTITGAAMFA